MVSMIRVVNFHFPEVEKIDFPRVEGVNFLEVEAMDFFHVEAMEMMYFEGKSESSDMEFDVHKCAKGLDVSRMLCIIEEIALASFVLNKPVDYWL